MRILDGLYHVELGLPAFTLGVKVITPRYGRHALEQAQNDRYGQIELPKVIDLTQGRIIEIEILNGRLAKAVFRMKLDAKRDLCLVIQPDGFVRTVWVNLASDLHRTLDRSKYIALNK